MKKRGQISVEYLILLGFITFLVLVLLGLALFSSGSIEDKLRFSELESFARNVIDGSESVYYAGEPSKITITSYLPSGVQSISVSGTDLFFSISTRSGVTTLSYTSSVPLSGSLNASEGVHRIVLEATSGGVSVNDG